LIDKSASSPFCQQLSAEALEAAMRSALDSKVIALGKAWARGVYSEVESVTAQERQVVQALARTELPHVRVLEVVSGDFQRSKVGATALATGWTPEMIQGALPAYGPLVHPLTAVLVSEGLISDSAIRSEMVVGPFYLITAMGNLILDRLREAESPSPQPL
jgi:hypothetical protein